jgi:hypothetical protein
MSEAKRKPRAIGPATGVVCGGHAGADGSGGCFRQR